MKKATFAALSALVALLFACAALADITYDDDYGTANGRNAAGRAGYGYVSGDNLGAAGARGTAVVISRRVAVRSGMSTGSKNLAYANNGDVLSVLSGGNGNWLHVEYDNGEKQYDGYVQRMYVIERPLTVTVRTANTPAYSAPTKASKLVGSLDAYTELTVIGTYDDFYIVNLRQASAFLPIDTSLYTSKDVETLFGRGRGEAVTIRKTQGHSGPSDKWPKGPSIPSGTDLTVAREEDGWMLALYDGKLVYVDADDLKITRRPSGSKRTPQEQGRAQGGETITLPRVSGVTLTYWAVPESDSQTPDSRSISLAQATEYAVQELISKYSLRRRDLQGYEIHYSYRTSARTAYGVNAPYWSIWFWAGEDEGILWDVDVNARTGAILYSAGVDDSNG